MYLTLEKHSMKLDNYNKKKYFKSCLYERKSRSEGLKVKKSKSFSIT